MNTAVRIFLAVFVTFASAWLGLVFFPHLQLRDLRAQVDEVTGEEHPAPYSGEALLGRASYMSLGCTYCHSQQVRGGFWNADLERGWGLRRSHPRDYIYDEPQLLGTMRTGPDLANIGARQPSRAWHLLHLYDPQITSPGSIMPPHRFLFTRRRIVGQPASDALALEGEFAPEEGHEIVPTREAHNLVTYLLGLNQMYEIED